MHMIPFKKHLISLSSKSVTVTVANNTAVRIKRSKTLQFELFQFDHMKVTGTVKEMFFGLDFSDILLLESKVKKDSLSIISKNSQRCFQKNEKR